MGRMSGGQNSKQKNKEGILVKKHTATTLRLDHATACMFNAIAAIKGEVANDRLRSFVEQYVEENRYLLNEDAVRELMEKNL